MSESNELYASVNYIKNKVDTLEKIEIKYNLGLYKIVKTMEKGKMKIVLKPFFIK